jgi:hypothetical protein
MRPYVPFHDIMTYSKQLLALPSNSQAEGPPCELFISPPSAYWQLSFISGGDFFFLFHFEDWSMLHTGDINDWYATDFHTTDNVLVNHRVNNFHPYHGTPTHDPPCCIMWPAVTLVNYVYTIKSRKRLGIRLMWFCLAACEPVHSDRCSPLPLQGWTMS